MMRESLWSLIGGEEKRADAFPQAFFIIPEISGTVMGDVTYQASWRTYSWNDAWTYNETHHWHNTYCLGCGAKIFILQVFWIFGTLYL